MWWGQWDGGLEDFLDAVKWISGGQTNVRADEGALRGLGKEYTLPDLGTPYSRDAE